MQDNSKITFIDLFAGVGGFHLALKGSKCLFASEIDSNAQKTYHLNFPKTPLFGDITLDSTQNQIPQNFDILCAGFPCQAFSIAGYQKGFEDTRGTLFFEIAKITQKHKPKVLFLENVKNLKNHDKGKTFEVIKSTLEQLEYCVYDKVLNSATHANLSKVNKDLLNLGKSITDMGMRKIIFVNLQRMGLIDRFNTKKELCDISRKYQYRFM